MNTYKEGLREQVATRVKLADTSSGKRNNNETRRNVMDTGLGFGFGHGNSSVSSSGISRREAQWEETNHAKNKTAYKQALDQQRQYSQRRAAADASEFVDCSIPFDPFYERSMKAREAKDAATRAKRMEHETSLRVGWKKEQQAKAERDQRQKQEAPREVLPLQGLTSKREKQVQYKRELDKQV